MEENALQDLTLRCNICKGFFTLSSVLEHRKHHRAMRIMRFKEGKGPRSIDSLTKRHMMLLKKVLAKFKDTPSDPNLMRRIERINESYETLRFEFTKDDARLKAMLTVDGMTSMRDGYFEPRDRDENDQVETRRVAATTQEGFPTCVYGIGHSQAVNRDWRDAMEDVTAIHTKVAGPSFQDQGVWYIGMFDGYHGATAAQTCGEKMHEIISEQITNYSTHLECENINVNEVTGFLSTQLEDDNDELKNRKMADADVSKCMVKSYLKMDEYLAHGINEKSRVRWSGCSALTCLIEDDMSSRTSAVNEKGDGPAGDSKSGSQDGSDKTTSKNCKIGKAYISNAGNVRAVLYHKKKSHELSHLHTLDNTKEEKRVIDAGAKVNSSERHPRVNGVLDTTRGIGNHGDPVLKQCVITYPHTSVARLTGETQMMVIATNSVWEVLSPSDAFSVLVNFIPPSASTVLRSGPTPIIPVIHGRSGRKGDTSDGHQLSSTLPSIVETEEEEGIEEVIFVQAQQSDSEDEEIKEEILFENIGVDSAIGGVLVSSSDSSLVVNNTEAEPHKDSTRGEAYSFEESQPSFATEESAKAGSGDGDKSQEQNSRDKYALIASVLSDQLVRAAMVAGAVENVSVVVVLFKGMFH